MGAFHSSTMIEGDHTLMRPIATAIASEFLNEDFKVKTDSMISGGYVVSITKGNLFKAALGMNLALTVVIKPVDTGINVDASVGLIGQQAIPTYITMCFAWPVLLTQCWGLIQQAKLDDKAIQIACETAKRIPTSKSYCPYCGAEVLSSATTCPKCKNDLRFS